MHVNGSNKAIGSKSTKGCIQICLFDFITVCKPEREIDATSRKAASDQKWWLGRRGGSWKHYFMMLSLISQLPLRVPFVGNCLWHSPTDPLLLWGDVSVTACQDLAWCYQVGAEPGTGLLDIVVSWDSGSTWPNVLEDMHVLSPNERLCLTLLSVPRANLMWKFSDNSLWCCWGMGYQEACNVLEVWAAKDSREFT